VELQPPRVLEIYSRQSLSKQKAISGWQVYFQSEGMVTRAGIFSFAVASD
jgi:hypothetical protein